MNTTKVIAGIDEVIRGLNDLKVALADSATPEVATAVVTTIADSGDTYGGYTAEQLNSMKYNEFKKVAASLGVKCTGTRDEIMSRIVNGVSEVVAEVAEEPVEKPVEVEETVVEEPEEDEFDHLAHEIADETGVEDTIEALKDVGIEANKTNYVAKLADALRQGLIEVDDEEESKPVEEEPVSEVEEETENKGVTAEYYFSEYDPDGLNDPDKMTKKRHKAVVEKMQEILDSFDNDELDEDTVDKFLEEYATEDEIGLLNDPEYLVDKLSLYMELNKRFIDDDGVDHDDEEPYEINGENVCCGHVLKYSDDTKVYVCEICGAEYEAE